MLFTKENKIVIKWNLFELKGYNARHLVREFSRKKAKMSAAMGHWLVDHRPGSGRWHSARIDLVLHKNG